MHGNAYSNRKQIKDPSPRCILLDRTYNTSFEPAKDSVVSNIVQVETEYSSLFRK